MNYWHMQLHPDNSTTFNTDTIKRLLKEKKIIGLGEWDNDGGKRDQFYNRLTIGDIVAVKNGGEPIALVRVIDNAYFDRNIDDNFDWFPNRRKIEILDFYKDEYNFTIPQPRGTLSICENLDTPTSRIIIDWYKKIKLEQLMENIKLQPERIAQIKSLWDKYKTDFPQTEREKIPQQLDSHINEWSIYRDKIINDTFTLDDYTNTISNSKLSKEAGWYLCNFLERTTSNVLGSSKPGTAGNFEVKLNSDNTTYYIKNDKKDNATKDEAEQFFALNIKPLIKNIVQVKRQLTSVYFVNKGILSYNSNLKSFHFLKICSPI